MRHAASVSTQALGLREPVPIPEPVDELDALEVLGDRGALVVDEAGVEPGALDGLEVEVGREARRLLRPRDPEPSGGIEAARQPVEAAPELDRSSDEEEDDVHPVAGTPEAFDAGRQRAQIEAPGRAGDQ